MRRRHQHHEPRLIVRRKEITPECIRAVSASTDYSWPACWTSTPSNVLDRDETTEWSTRSPAWIRLDLGPSAPCVSRIELLPSMTDQGGSAECRIMMGMHMAAMDPVMIMGGICAHRRWLECNLNQSKRARYVEIHTVDAPKWTGWIRIRVWTER